MKTINTLACVLVSSALFGCNSEPGPATDAERRLGYVSLVDGTMGVVDLATMDVVHRIKESHRGTHMLHVIESTGEVLYGDWDTNEILVLDLAADGASHEVVERIPSPVQMHGFMTLPPDDRYLVVLSRLELKAALDFPATHDDRSIGVYDRQLGTWRTLELASPSYAALGPDGRLYVTNVHDQSISVVDLTTLQETSRVKVGADWAAGDTSIGPKSVAFSPDGRTLVTADYEGMSLTVFDVTADGPVLRQVIPTNGVPKAATFSDDGTELWVVTYDLNVPRVDIVAAAGTLASMGEWYEGPQPADEARNAERRTTLRVLDAAGFEPIATLSTPKAMISPTIDQADPNTVYVTTSAGSIYAIDRASFRVVGEAVVGRVGVPVVCGNLSL